MRLPMLPLPPAEPGGAVRLCLPGSILPGAFWGPKGCAGAVGCMARGQGRRPRLPTCAVILSRQPNAAAASFVMR
jgi:hypothetical protein